PYVDLVIESPRAYYCIIAVAPSIIFSCLMCTYRGYNQGLKYMSPTAISQVIEVLFKAAGGLAGAYLFKNYFTNEFSSFGTVFGSAMSAADAEVTILSLAAAGAMFGVSLSTFAGYLYLALRHLFKGDGITKEQLEASPEPNRNGKILKQILRIGIPIALSSVAVTITGLIDNVSILDRLNRVVASDINTLYASHLGVLELAEKQAADLPNYLYGVYNMAMPIFNLVPALTGSFGMSALPHISSSWMLKDMPLTKKYMESAMRVTMLIAAPAGFGIAFLAGPISKLIYASRPVGAQLLEPMLTVLGIAAIFVAVVNPINAMLQAVGRVDVPVILMIVGGLIKLATNYFIVAIPFLNIKAAPLGNLLCFLTITLASIVVLRRVTKINLNMRSVMGRPLLAGLLTGAYALVSYNLIVGITSLSEKLATVAAIAVGGVVYLISIGMMKAIEPDDVIELPGGKKLVNFLEKLHIIR
ncbi:MAG: hypothetical protein GX683_07335, partial [Ruminococcaceae bacterium]|nr:hypothetical protein [Oscillospiraceae bacterium]